MAGDKPNRLRVNEYNLATCLLVNDGLDFVNQVNGSPAHLWKGWAVDLGGALGRREESNGGLWTRRFSGGVVYTVEPGGTTHTIKLGKKMHSAEWAWGGIDHARTRTRRGPRGMTD